MKKIIITIIALLILPIGVGAASLNVPWTYDTTGIFLYPYPNSNAKVGIGTTSPYAKLSVVGETVSSYFTATTTATSTLPRLTSTGFSTTWLCLTGDICRTTWPTGTFPFTPTTNYGATTNATGTPVWFQAGLQASSTSRLKNFTAINSTTTNATTTSLGIGSLTGVLSGSSGVVGATSLGADQILMGTGSGFSAITANSANGWVKLDANGNQSGYVIIPRVSSTTEIDTIPLDEGELAVATSTPPGLNTLRIGDGMTVGGLIVNPWNYSTTTGNVDYTRGFVGVASSSPSAKVGIVAEGSERGLYVKDSHDNTAILADRIRGAGGYFNGETYGIITDTPSAFNHSIYSQTGLNYFQNSVGVGTTSPSTSLSVHGTGGMYNGGNFFNAGRIISTSTASSILPYASTTALTSSGSAYFATGGGNVGVGTTTPTYPITTFSSTLPQLSLSNGAGVAMWTARNAGGNLYLATTTVQGMATTSSSALSINGSNGRVGIGISNPGSPFNVHTMDGSGIAFQMTGKARYGGVDADGVVLVYSFGGFGDTNQQFSLCGKNSGQCMRFLGYTIDGYNYLTDTRQNMTLGTDTSDVTVARHLTVTNRTTTQHASTTGALSVAQGAQLATDGSSRVGIRNTTPNSALTIGINNSAVAGSNFSVVGTDAILHTMADSNPGTSGLDAYDRTETRKGFFGFSGSSASLLPGTVISGSIDTTNYNLITNSTARLTVGGSTGNVGIASTSPWRTLSVVGTMSVNGLTLNTGAAAASLCLSAENDITRNTDNETCLSSSERYKKNIERLNKDDSLQTILSLKPVSFQYKDSDVTHYGLIAEDVEKIDPLLVSYDDEGKSNGIRWTHITTEIVNSIRVIVDTMRTMIAKISGLEQRLNEQEERIKALEAKLLE